MDVEVTSVAKKSQKLSDAAAAIFVITQEDLRRSGVTSIPEALRMVPGIQVARIDANKWAISARGFNGRFANKLLVLIDGRSVYTPLFAGVYWEVQDLPLEDIERIEVIRGPGATLWGANAVNGIVNIISKHARDTQGGLLTAGGGTEERGFVTGRYGVALDNRAYLRAYAKYFSRDGFVDTEGSDTADDWHVGRGGFRLDWDAPGANKITLQGDVYRGEAGQTLRLPSLRPPFISTLKDETNLFGANLLTRWQHAFSDTSDLTLQLYYDHTDREEPILREIRDTFDLDFQHRVAVGRRHELLWGVGYRLTRDNFTNGTIVSLNPDSRTVHLFSAFIQDDITLIRDRLRLTLGSKFEHNDFTGFEIQPNARILWTPGIRHTVWAAVSRAIRSPSRAENDVRINFTVIPPATPGLNPGPLPILSAISGNRDFDSETLLAYELGYRVRPTDGFFFDIALFFNVYDNLRSTEVGTPVPELMALPPHVVIPTVFDNKMDGKTYGVEVAVDWWVLQWWHVQAAYTYLQVKLNLDNDSTDTTGESIEEQTPRHQFSLRSGINLPWNVEFDAWLRYVGKLPDLDVKRYVSLDLRLGWKPLTNLELSLVAQNILTPSHPEFVQELFPVRIEVERGLYGKMTWHF